MVNDGQFNKTFTQIDVGTEKCH